MSEQKKQENNSDQAVKEYALESLITSSMQIPGVKVNRTKFLAEAFSDVPELIPEIIEKGPVEAGIKKERLDELSSKHIIKRTSQSSIASFTAGLPGGFAMAATIPADVLQFFGMSLRTAQELAYMYGTSDFWNDGAIDEERVKKQFILYFGVMFGVSSAVSGVRVLTTQLAKVTLKKLPQKALTKTFWYPIVKQIGKAIGVKVTKSSVAKGFSKAIPVIGGVISGTLNFASMMPMAKRLRDTLDKAVFDYSEEEFEADISIIENPKAYEEDIGSERNESFKEKLSDNIKSVSGSVSGMFSKLKKDKKKQSDDSTDFDHTLEQIEKLAELKDSGIITQDEFEAKKKVLLNL